MPVSNWTFAFFAFVAPGFAYLQVFALGARIRRAASNDVLFNALTFFLASILTNIVMFGIDAAFFGNVFLNHLAEAITVKTPCAIGGVSDDCRAALIDHGSILARYTLFSMVLAGFFAFLASHLVAWGFLPIGRHYYGPLFPIIRGVPRWQVVATVATRLTAKVAQLNNTQQPPTRDVELPIMYKGWLDEIRLTSSGRIDYISLSRPVKAFFDPPIGGHVKSDPISIGADQSNVRVDRILIEGSDIQNVYFAQLNAPLDLPVKAQIKTALVSLLRAWPIFLALLVVSFFPKLGAVAALCSAVLTIVLVARPLLRLLKPQRIARGHHS